jgi:hypothetical protein
LIGIKLRELQWEHLQGAKHAYFASLEGGVVSGLEPIYDLLGKTSKKRFMIIHVNPNVLVFDLS